MSSISGSSTSNPGENLDSAAKVMAEALSKASEELEKTVEALSDHMMSFNQSVERSFQDEVEAAKQRLEATLKQNLDLLIKDKEQLIKVLAACKQNEIERVIQTAKSVRANLAGQVEQATLILAKSVSTRMADIRGILSAPEAEITSRFQESLNTLQTSGQAHFEMLERAIHACETAVGESFSTNENKVNSFYLESQKDFDEKTLSNRAEIQSQVEQVMAELAVKHDELSTQLDDNYTSAVTNIELETKAISSNIVELSQSTNQYFQDLTETFSGSLDNLSGLLSGLYETRLNNLAAQSRTEILSAAQHASELLIATRSEMQVCLKEFQRDYVAKFEALLTKFEKIIEEESKFREISSLSSLQGDNAKEHLEKLFSRLGRDMVESATGSATKLESDFQQSINLFEQRLVMTRTQAIDSLQRESKLMQQDLSRAFQEFESQVSVLKSQVAQIEKHGQDAANIVMTIKQANLEF